MDDDFEDSLNKNSTNETEMISTKRGQSQITIDMLPDVALLEIFDFYVKENLWWYTLVHVCRNWRNVVFGSPSRLNLQLICEAKTPVRETLNVWPPLPIFVWSHRHKVHGVDNLVAALEHNDRVSGILLYDFSSSQSEIVFAAMRQPFPALTDLTLMFNNGTAPVNPASFFGGVTPPLKSLSLLRNPSLKLLKLLLSATDLVNISLRSIPDSGYISPEALVTCLSALTRLETLTIDFESSQSRRHLPPPTRTLFPVLTKLDFLGVSEYLEDLVARIDVPLLDNLQITFFDAPLLDNPLLLDNLQLTFFDRLVLNTPQLTDFISRAPKFKTHDTAHLVFSHVAVSVKASDERLCLKILFSQSDRHLPSLVQICSSFPPAVIATVERLFIFEDISMQEPRPWQHIENGQWLELFQPFTAVKHLYISSEFTPHVAPALQDLVGEGVLEVLPALQSLFLEETHLSGPAQEAIGGFIDARQLAGHPVAISRWERKRVRIRASSTR